MTDLSLFTPHGDLFRICPVPNKGHRGNCGFRYTENTCRWKWHLNAGAVFPKWETNDAGIPFVVKNPKPRLTGGKGSHSSIINWDLERAHEMKVGRVHENRVGVRNKKTRDIKREKLLARVSRLNVDIARENRDICLYEDLAKKCTNRIANMNAYSPYISWEEKENIRDRVKALNEELDDYHEAISGCREAIVHYQNIIETHKMRLA